MSLTGKLVDLIYEIATGNVKKKIFLAPIVGLMYLVFIVFFVFISTIVDLLVKFPIIFPNPWNHLLSIPIVAIGFFLMAYSIFHFVKVKGTPVPFSPPLKLISSGPYKYARNPMLTGIFIQLFGIAIDLNSLALFFIFTPLFIAINVWELKKLEEPELIKRFGKDYIAYKNKVPMFFPKYRLHRSY